MVHVDELTRRNASWSWYIPVPLSQGSIGGNVAINDGLLLVRQIEILPEMDEIALCLENQEML
jgi:hypothetical protein